MATPNPSADRRTQEERIADERQLHDEGDDFADANGDEFGVTDATDGASAQQMMMIIKRMLKDQRAEMQVRDEKFQAELQQLRVQLPQYQDRRHDEQMRTPPILPPVHEEQAMPAGQHMVAGRSLSVDRVDRRHDRDTSGVQTSDTGSRGVQNTQRNAQSAAQTPSTSQTPPSNGGEATSSPNGHSHSFQSPLQARRTTPGVNQLEPREPQQAAGGDESSAPQARRPQVDRRLQYERDDFDHRYDYDERDEFDYGRDNYSQHGDHDRGPHSAYAFSCKRMLASLPDFYGTNRDRMKWERWVQRYVLHCEINMVPLGSYVSLLAERLHGSAYDVYFGILKRKPEITWVELEETLTGYFEPRKSSTLQMSKFYVAVWDSEKHETINSFVTRLHGLVQEGLPDTDVNTQEQLVKMKLLESLPLAWKTQIEVWDNDASLDRIVKLAIDIQTQEEAAKGVSYITNAIKSSSANTELKSAKGQSKFGAKSNSNSQQSSSTLYNNRAESARGSFGRNGYRGGNRGGYRGSYNASNNTATGTTNSNSTTGQQSSTSQGAQGSNRGGNRGGRGNNYGRGSNGRGNGGNGGNSGRNYTNAAVPDGGQPQYQQWEPTPRGRGYGRGRGRGYGRGRGGGRGGRVSPVHQTDASLSRSDGTWRQYVNAVSSGFVSSVTEGEERVSTGRVWTLDVKVGNQQTKAMFDTGATISIISADLFCKYAADLGDASASRMTRKHDSSHRAINGQLLPFTGEVDAIITLGDQIAKVPCLILKDTPTPLLLGDTFAKAFGVWCSIGDKRQAAWRIEPNGVRSTKGAAEFQMDLNGSRTSVVCHASADTKIMSGHRMTLSCQAPKDFAGTECLVQFNETQCVRDICIPDHLVKVGSDGEFHVSVDNYGSDPTTVCHGAEVVTIEIADTTTACDSTVGAISQKPASSAHGKSYTNHYAEIMKQVNMGKGKHPRDAQQVAKLIGRYQDVFALNNSELGKVRGVKHDIPTVSETDVVRHKPRPIAPRLVKELKACVDDMEQAGIIQKTESNWASPIVPIRKSDGTWRICVDYRDLNAITLPHQWPLPRIDDLLFELGQTHPRYIAKLDLKAGYWQIQLTDEARKKSAFVTPWCHMEYTRMPFGLMAAPMTFQRMVDTLFTDADRTKVLWFMDDFLIVGNTLDEFCTNLEYVFKKFRQADLKIGPNKCEVLCDRVTFLGYIVSEEGLEIDNSKTDIVRNYPRPTNLTQVRRFLGFINYYRRFIKGCGKIQTSLNNLLKKEEAFTWSDECETSYQLLRARLLEAPILRYVDIDNPIYLETDACRTGLGAVLAQESETKGTLHACYYIGRATTKAEQNLSVIDLEALGVVYAIQKFHKFLFGAETYIITDHQALVSLRAKRELEPKMARWAAMIMDINPTFLYRPGKHNAAADAISRIPYGLPDRLTIEALDEDFVMMLYTPDKGNQAPLTPLTTHGANAAPSVGDRQRRDPYLAAMIDFVTAKVLPQDESLKMLVTESSKHYEYVHPVLYRRHVRNYGGKKKETILLVAVPPKERHRLIKDAHCGRAGGHFSAYKTFGKLMTKFHWPTMLGDCKKFCADCRFCRQRDGGERIVTPPMEPIPVPMVPGDQIGMDIQELHSSVNGNRYTVLFIDYASKYPVMVPIPNHRVETVARAMVDHWISLFGPPKVIISDRGAEIIGRVMSEVCQIFDISQQTTTVYHPQSDGLAERFHRTIQAMLAKTMQGKNLDRWDEFLQPLLLGYRMMPNSTTKFTPAKLIFGRELRMPTDSEMAREVSVLQDIEANDYVTELRKGLNAAWQAKQDNIESSQRQQKETYDRVHRVRPAQLQEGDQVFYKNPALKKGPAYKLKSDWDGPYEVTDVTSSNVYIKKVGQPRKDAKCVHITKVSKVAPSASDRVTAPTTSTPGDANDELDATTSQPSVSARGGDDLNAAPTPTESPRAKKGRPRKKPTVQSWGGDDSNATTPTPSSSATNDSPPHRGTRFYNQRCPVVAAVFCGGDTCTPSDPKPPPPTDFVFNMTCMDVFFQTEVTSDSGDKFAVYSNLFRRGIRRAVHDAIEPSRLHSSRSGITTMDDKDRDREKDDAELQRQAPLSDDDVFSLASDDEGEERDDIADDDEGEERDDIADDDEIQDVNMDGRETVAADEPMSDDGRCRTQSDRTDQDEPRPEDAGGRETESAEPMDVDAEQMDVDAEPTMRVVRIATESEDDDVTTPASVHDEDPKWVDDVLGLASSSAAEVQSTQADANVDPADHDGDDGTGIANSEQLMMLDMTQSDGDDSDDEEDGDGEDDEDDDTSPQSVLDKCAVKADVKKEVDDSDQKAAAQSAQASTDGDDDDVVIIEQPQPVDDGLRRSQRQLEQRERVTAGRRAHLAEESHYYAEEERRRKQRCCEEEASAILPTPPIPPILPTSPDRAGSTADPDNNVAAVQPAQPDDDDDDDGDEEEELRKLQEEERLAEQEQAEAARRQAEAAQRRDEAAQRREEAEKKASQD